MKPTPEKANASGTVRTSGKSKPATDHLGNEYPAQKAMCAAWGINRGTYNDRLKRGMSIEEALTTPLAPHVRQR